MVEEEETLTGEGEVQSGIYIFSTSTRGWAMGIQVACQRQISGTYSIRQASVCHGRNSADQT